MEKARLDMKLTWRQHALQAERMIHATLEGISSRPSWIELVAAEQRLTVAKEEIEKALARIAALPAVKDAHENLSIHGIKKAGELGGFKIGAK